MKLQRKDFLGLLALTIAAFLVHGYHPYSEDAETYLPGIEKVLNPRLFPVGAEYFQLHAHMTWFPQLIAYSVRLLHLPLPWVLFLWQIASFFLFLLACLHLMRLVFPSAVARWAGVALITALFTMPVAGTALYLMDPFLNPRNIIACLEIFGVTQVLERRYVRAAALVAFSVSFCLLTVVIDRWPWKRSAEVRNQVEEALPVARAGSLFMFMPMEKMFEAPTKAYEDVAANHRYQFLARWTWYEMLGGIAPIFILWWFSAIARARKMQNLDLLCRATAIYGVIYFILGLIVSIPHRLEVLSLVQPMRSLHLLYVLMLLFGGGLLGEYVLRNRVWRWLVLFLPLSGGMLYAQRSLYPASAHIEWPWAKPSNPWVQAFEWARDNTPDQAIFALDPYYMNIDGEDADGFRAIAQRSQLADGAKDSGVVELFPQIGDSWQAQVKAQKGIDQFQSKDFEPLQRQYAVTWVVLRTSSTAEIACPYSNQIVKVCRLPQVLP